MMFVGNSFSFIAGLGSGAAGGILAGLFGVGGGLVLIPLLAFFLHLNQHQAQGVTLAAMLLPNGLPAVIHYRRRGVPIHWPLVVLLTAGFLVGVFGGAQLANLIPSVPLRYGFVALLLALGVRTYMLDTPGGTEPAAVGEPGFSRIWVPGLLIGCAGGLASGLLGIGGAILMNPLLAWRLRLPQHQVQLTSLALMLAPIGLPGVLVYAKAQNGLPWWILTGVALGFAAGAYGGARLAMRLHGTHLRRIYAGVMVLMAVLLLLRRA